MIIKDDDDEKGFFRQDEAQLIATAFIYTKNTVKLYLNNRTFFYFFLKTPALRLVKC